MTDGEGAHADHCADHDHPTDDCTSREETPIPGITTWYATSPTRGRRCYLNEIELYPSTLDTLIGHMQNMHHTISR